MKSNQPEFGLVLTGGGAKGAYQAGAVEYIAESGLQPQIIAGTSIGALNGAVLASYYPFSHAVERLNKFWEQLGEAEILRPHTGTILQTLSYSIQAFTPTLRHWLVDFLIKQGFKKNKTSIFDPEPIEQLLKQAVHPNTLRKNIELWVTVFPSLKIPGLGYDLLIDLIRAKTGAGACWLCLQDCMDDETIYNLLLASAALPLAFPSREVNGINYIDGGLVDNVPMRALAKRGCKNVIVIHLKNGSVWNRDDFPEQTIIEIRPEKAINKSEIPVIGVVDSWLDFSSQRIAKLKQQGYEDAKRCLNPIIDSLIAVREYRQSQVSLIDSTKQLINDAPL